MALFRLKSNAMKPITRVVIVGGGTAGWITAGTLAAKLSQDRSKGLTITLIESPTIPAVGVGEGTWPTMRTTLKNMGVAETDFIRQCHATFKQGARFARWVTGDESDAYYHPLVEPAGFKKVNLATHCLERDTIGSFSRRVSPQDALCDAGKPPKSICTPEYAGLVNYAYHLDAAAFSNFLKAHCQNALGVRLIEDDVIEVLRAENGDISAVRSQGHGCVEGDLFIDCTGFRALLLGEALGVPFRSCQSILPNNAALAVQVPYSSELTPIASHTISTAQANGWIWDIGLQHRRGVGYVYSDEHESDALAYDTLVKYLGQTKSDFSSSPVRKIAITPGHRALFWKHNCVAVGLSAGFLEPLEASALVLVEVSASMLAEQFPRSREAMHVLRERFNDTFLYRWARIIDFLKLHYVLTQRQDSEYWRRQAAMDAVPDSLLSLLTLWRYQAPWHDDFDRAVEVFPAASYQYVLYGMQFKTRPDVLGVPCTESARASRLFREVNEDTSRLLASLPSHRELIDKIHRFGLQKI